MACLQPSRRWRSYLVLILPRGMMDVMGGIGRSDVPSFGGDVSFLGFFAIFSLRWSPLAMLSSFGWGWSVHCTPFHAPAGSAGPYSASKSRGVHAGWCFLAIKIVVLAAVALLTLAAPLRAAAQPAALVAAAAQGQVAEVARLLDAGVPVESRGDTVASRNATVLVAATQGNHVDVVRLLISRGADVNAQDSLQDSAFLLAGASGYTDIVRATLAAGADLKSTNRYGGTALIPACHHAHTDTVRLLLTTAIDVNHVNRLGWTCLLEAVILGDGSAPYVEVVRMLVAARANLNAPDGQGVTPLQHAEAKGQRAVAAALKAAGAR
jgi:hypothetical protein